MKIVFDEWRERAACQSTLGAAHFPAEGRNYRAAKRICAECPVIATCLEFAMVNEEAYGVWGGMSPPDRRELAQLRIKEQAAVSHLPVRGWPSGEVAHSTVAATLRAS